MRLYQNNSLREQAGALRALHHGNLLVLPNAWDVASARAVETAGFPVVATSSHAVAAVLGYDDHDSMPPDEAFGAVTRIAGNVGVPVTADLEAGYQLPAPEFVDRLLAAGAVGCNYEDTDHHGQADLVAVDDQAARLAAIREAAASAGVDIVINARIDAFLRQELSPELVAAALERARAYREAGADCVYPIFLVDERAIGEFCRAIDGPVNITVRPDGPSLARLAELGVARASYAGGLYRVAHVALREALDHIAAMAR